MDKDAETTRLMAEIAGSEGRFENALANVRDCESAKDATELRSSILEAVREAEAGLAVLRAVLSKTL